jgi:hypothetical protein
MTCPAATSFGRGSMICGMAARRCQRCSSRSARRASGETAQDPEQRLYALLARTEGDGAHSRFNALIRRLVSFERAAESAA